MCQIDKDPSSTMLHVSIVLTTYNRAKLLSYAIHSVLTQTFENFELIIVDDFSKDRTYEVVDSLNDKRIKYIRHKKNQGLAAARNTGIRHAIGQYIAFLDDDDEWLPTKLQMQIECIQTLSSSVGMVYCWADIYSADQRISVRCPKLRGKIFSDVIANQPLCNGSTWLLKKQAIDKVGQFDENLYRGIDGDYVRRLCLIYEVDYIPEILVKYHINHDHERITNFTDESIHNAIIGHKTKLKKFSLILENYPRQTSEILANIAYHYSELGDWQRAIQFYYGASTRCFYARKIYLFMLRSLIKFMKRKSV